MIVLRLNKGKKRNLPDNCVWIMGQSLLKQHNHLTRFIFLAGLFVMTVAMEHLTCRTLAMIGGVMFGLGVILASQAKTLVEAILYIGVLTGALSYHMSLLPHLNVFRIVLYTTETSVSSINTFLFWFVTHPGVCSRSEIRRYVCSLKYVNWMLINMVDIFSGHKQPSKNYIVNAQPKKALTCKTVQHSYIVIC